MGHDRVGIQVSDSGLYSRSISLVNVKAVPVFSAHVDAPPQRDKFTLTDSLIEEGSIPSDFNVAGEDQTIAPSNLSWIKHPPILSPVMMRSNCIGAMCE
jgi:hypothetical protein